MKSKKLSRAEEALFVYQAAQLLLSLAGLKVLPKVKFEDRFKNLKSKN